MRLLLVPNTILADADRELLVDRVNPNLRIKCCTKRANMNMKISQLNKWVWQAFEIGPILDAITEGIILSSRWWGA